MIAGSSVPAVVRERARLSPDLEGLVDASRGAGSGDSLRLSFAEVSDRIDAAARAFVAAGVEPGDRVGIWAPNIAEWVFAAFGALAAGAVVVPLNTRFKGAEAAFVLGRSRAKVLCCVNGFLGNDYVGMLRDAGVPESVQTIVVLRGDMPEDAPDAVVSYDEFVARGESVAAAVVDARIAALQGGDVCDIIFTSGTTGKPKGAMLTHEQSLRVF